MFVNWAPPIRVKWLIQSQWGWSEAEPGLNCCLQSPKPSTVLYQPSCKMPSLRGDDKCGRTITAQPWRNIGRRYPDRTLLCCFRQILQTYASSKGKRQLVSCACWSSVSMPSAGSLTEAQVPHLGRQDGWLEVHEDSSLFPKSPWQPGSGTWGFHMQASQWDDKHSPGHRASRAQTRLIATTLMSIKLNIPLWGRVVSCFSFWSSQHSQKGENLPPQRAIKTNVIETSVTCLVHWNPVFRQSFLQRRRELGFYLILQGQGTFCYCFEVLCGTLTFKSNFIKVSVQLTGLFSDWMN